MTGLDFHFASDKAIRATLPTGSAWVNCVENPGDSVSEQNSFGAMRRSVANHPRRPVHREHGPGLTRLVAATIEQPCREATVSVETKQGTEPEPSSESLLPEGITEQRRASTNPRTACAFIGLAILFTSYAVAQVHPETLAAWSGYDLRPVGSNWKYVSVAEAGSIVASARNLAHKRLQNFPNFLCEMVVQRLRSRTKAARLRWSQTMGEILAQVRFANGSEEYRMVSIGGKRTKKSFDAGKGRLSAKGEFVVLLGTVFHTSVQFRWHGSATANGRPVHVFKVIVSRRIGAPISRGRGYPKGRVDWEGFVYIDRDSEHTLAIVLEAVNIPWSYGILRTYTSVFYGDVQIGGETHLLPVASEALAINPDTPMYRQSSKYRNYRKFEVESELLFENVESTVSYPR